MKILKGISYSENSQACQLDLHLPEEKSFPVFIYFHGGGLEGGSREDCGVFARYLTKKGIAVVSADYRLYPSARYPDFICDAAAAVAWTEKHLPTYGGNGRLYVGGSSAGAYLSMMLCFDKRFLAVHQIDSDAISGYVFDAGQPTAHFNVLRERGFDTRRIIVDPSAPLYHVNRNSFAPMLILVADNDMFGRYEQNRLLLSAIRHFDSACAVEFRTMENCEHCSYIGQQHGQVSIFGEIIETFIRNAEQRHLS